ncbi:hypothetical protein QPM05_15550 [Caldibacillus thermoamylovorans]|nr:hypothetical protein [Caldibacillus thermoamylovorans]
MAVRLKDFYFSYIFLGISLISFSFSFLNYSNPIMTTVLFLLLVNLTSFTNEYLVIKYFQKHGQKSRNKGYILFVTVQLLYTIGIFLVFKFLST